MFKDELFNILIEDLEETRELIETEKMKQPYYVRYWWIPWALSGFASLFSGAVLIYRLLMK